MDLKTIWKCRNGIVEYLEENPESPQKEMLQTLLTNLIIALNNDEPLNDAQNIIPEKWEKSPIKSEDSNRRKIEKVNFNLDGIAFALGIYPAVTLSSEIDSVVSKISKIAGDPDLYSRALDILGIGNYLMDSKEIDSVVIPKAERDAVIKVYGKDAKVVRFEEYLDWIIEPKEKGVEVVDK